METWMRRWREFREAWVIIDDLDTALLVWGFTPARFAVFISIFIGVWFTALGHGIAWSVFAAIMVFPAVVWGLIGINELRERLLRPPDFDRWSKVKILPIWQAASLWAGRNPSPTITPASTIYPYLQQLKTAAEVGDLQTVDEDKSMKGRVRRENLIEYAETVGEKPRFLFPN